MSLQELAASTDKDSLPKTSKDKDAVVAPDIREKLKVQKNQSKNSRTDNFEEIITASKRIFSPSFGRDCQYRLILWQKRLREAEKEGKEVDLEKILTDSFPEVVEFSLTPLALPEVRLSVLKILLSQQLDNRHLKRILQSTTENVMQLPIGIVAEIVRLISIAPPTELRVESRRALVSAVINRRWYEVGAKHLVFFMFQMDELYDVSPVHRMGVNLGVKIYGLLCMVLMFFTSYKSLRCFVKKIFYCKFLSLFKILIKSPLYFIT